MTQPSKLYPFITVAVRAKLFEIAQLDPAPDIRNDDPDAFVEDLALDSLDMMEMGMALEDAFRIEVRDDDFAKCKTVDDIVQFLVDKGAVAPKGDAQ